MTHLESVFVRMFPIRMSKGLELVLKSVRRGRGPRRADYWFTVSVGSFIDQYGDIQVRIITPEQVQDWYTSLKKTRSKNDPSKYLSPFTVNSYARAFRAYLNRLVDMGHLDQSPYLIRLDKLPKKSRKDIPQGDIDLMVQHSKRSIRDHALVLILRDTGARVGEVLTMKVSGLVITEGKTGLEGVAPVYSDKTAKIRYIMFSHDACASLQDYLSIRPHDAPDDIWLGRSGEVLTSSGVYQILRRIGQEAGVDRFNPHAFRHALAKRMMENNTPLPVMAEVLGHDDPQTTAAMYIQIDANELHDLYRRYVQYDHGD